MVRNENSYFRVLLLIVMSISLLTPHTVLAQTNTEEKKVETIEEIAVGNVDIEGIGMYTLGKIRKTHFRSHGGSRSSL